MYYLEFGELLKEFRARREGVTQTELGKAIDKHRNLVGRWEQGLERPKSRELVLKIAEILGLSRPETDKLLVAADYPQEYGTIGSTLPGTTQLETLTVERLRVTHLETGKGPAAPPEPVLTRVPRARAPRFVGRTDELEWLCQTLQSGGVAAVAGVRGLGGIGKTELAIAACGTLENYFDAPVIWLDCRAYTVAAIQDTLASHLGLALESDNLQVRANALYQALKKQPSTLYVLDDIRRHHLDYFEFLLPPSPPCAVLITTRRDDLPLPSNANFRPIDTLPSNQSQELLSSLLREHGLTADEQTAGEIATLLDHIPLALTLAARRAVRLSQRRGQSSLEPLTELLSELQKRRDEVIHQGGRSDLSVFITFQSSFEELDPVGQACFRRLGVFARNRFDRAALERVWELDEAAGYDCLMQLINAGLLVEETEPGRYWMHDLLREYAARQLARQDKGEREAARLAHAAHWVAFLDEITFSSIEDWRTLEAYRPEVEKAAAWLLVNESPAP